MNQVLPGYSYRDCDPIRVDDVRCPVTWKGNPDVSRLAGQPIKLRFYLKQAKMYSFTPRILHQHYVPSYD